MFIRARHRIINSVCLWYRIIITYRKICRNRSLAFGKKPKQRKAALNMATRDEWRWLLPTSSDLVVNAAPPEKPRQSDGKCVARDTRGKKASYNPNKLVFLDEWIMMSRICRVEKTILPLSAWIATKWNLRQGYVARPSPDLTNQMRGANRTTNQRRHGQTRPRLLPDRWRQWRN